MADLEKWTHAARDAENNSVLLAVPVQSTDADGGAWIQGLDLVPAGDTVFELAFGAVILAGVGIYSAAKRIKYRGRRVGDRGRNEKLVLLFYADRVDLHKRGRFGKKVGGRLQSHSIDQVHQPHAMTIQVADMAWLHSNIPSNKLDAALTDAGVVLQPGPAA